MTDVPAPLKAIVGLVAAAMDRLPEPRELPQKAVELPVLAVSALLQVSLRGQQIYAELTARGDEAIGQLRGAPDEPPAWASFDDEPGADGGAAVDNDAVDDADDGLDLDGETDLELDSVQAAASSVGTSATNLHSPSAFDLADDVDFLEDEGPDRPLGD